MSYDFQPVESLVNQVKGTTSFLRVLLSRKSAFAALIIVLGVVISKMLLG